MNDAPPNSHLDSVDRRCKRDRWQFSIRKKAVILLSVITLSCGAADDAQTPKQAEGTVVCPPVETLMPKTFERLDKGQLPGIRAFLGGRLTETQSGLLVDLVIDSTSAITATEFSALAELSEDPRVAGLTDSLVFLIDFILGSEQSAPRLEFIEALRLTLSTCGGQTFFSAVQEIIADPQTIDVLQTFGQVLDQSQLEAALNSTERAGFTSLVCNISARMMHPDFTVANDIVQPLRESDLLATDEPPLSSLLSALNIWLGPDRLLLPALSDTLCCSIYGALTCSALPTQPQALREGSIFVWTFYDFLVATMAREGSLISDLNSLLADQDANAALAPLKRIIDSLAASAELRATITSVLKVLLEPTTFLAVMEDIRVLVADGALTEIVAVLDALGAGCKVEGQTQ